MYINPVKKSRKIIEKKGAKNLIETGPLAEEKKFSNIAFRGLAMRTNNCKF